MKDYIEQNKERFYEELFSLLRIPSISAKKEHKEDMRRCAERLAVRAIVAKMVSIRFIVWSSYLFTMIILENSLTGLDLSSHLKRRSRP